MLEKTPAKIMEQLQDEIEKQGRADLRQHLSDAKALLPLFSKEQYLRPVRNVVAGMVATIIGIVCAGSDKTPIIMVSKPSQIKSDVAKLQSILDIIASLGYLIHPKIVVMKPARKYLCLKRLRNAESNGQRLSFLQMLVSQKAPALHCVQSLIQNRFGTTPPPSRIPVQRISPCRMP